MPSDIQIGCLLRTLVSSKPEGNFLELGTGTGLALSWLLDGMDPTSKITTLDTDSNLMAIAASYFGDDARASLLCEDAGPWIANYQGEKFDLIFADAWPGKYSYLDETLQLLKKGGFYVIDDMVEQPNWPVGHHEKANDLMVQLENRTDLEVVQMDWSTGISIAVKK